MPGWRPPQRAAQAAGIVAGLAMLAVLVSDHGLRQGLAFLIGGGLGFALHQSGFGFASGYRRFFAQRDPTLVEAQLLLVAATTVLLAPLLATGQFLGQPLSPASAPLALSVALGAFLFGIGMQLASGCGSGTLYALGTGNLRMGVVLIAFCAGGFWASLDAGSWASLPDAGDVVLGEILGWGNAVAVQLAFVALLFAALLRFARRRPAERRTTRWLRGPWPLWAGVVALALLNAATALVAGHPWTITWAFTLWAAKSAVLLGWDPATSSFWQGEFQSSALASGVLEDTTSVMDIGTLLGAALGATASRGFAFTLQLRWRPLVAAVAGGLMMGYGARLAYGCNIGAFVSGAASTSLHGWLWIACALPGTWLGMRLRPHFGLGG
ncbi:MAG: YeeE/YedE family protein [Rhodocyclaceae bacterium]